MSGARTWAAIIKISCATGSGGFAIAMGWCRALSITSPSCGPAKSRVSCSPSSNARSTVADDENVAVFDDVVFALEAELAFVAGAAIAAEVDQRLPVDHFGADELLFEIGVDGAGGLHGRTVLGNGPGPAFVFAGSEKAHQSEQRVGSGDQALQARFLQSVAGEVVALLFAGQLG